MKTTAATAIARVLPSRSSTAALERKLADLTKRRERFAREHAAAQRAYDEALGAQRQHMLEGDLDDARATARVDDAFAAAKVKRQALEDALRALAVAVEDTEHAIAEQRDRAERQRVATECEARAEAIEKAAAELQRTLVPVGEAYAALVRTIRQSGLGIGDFGLPVAPEHVALAILRPAIRPMAPGLIPDPVDFPGYPIDADSLAAARRLQAEALRAAGRAILAGEAPAVAPVAAVAIPIVPPPPTFPEVEVVLDRPISYTAVNGHTIQTPAGGVTIPEPVAEAAKAKGIGFDPGTNEAKAIVARLRSNPARFVGVLAPDRAREAETMWTNVGVSLYELAASTRGAA
ncbi:hypothetical protein [Chelatococcus reniformis]|uniref:Uncharacterized protein n=1 Tax=Chelatococcus reniformis TaxID=1494448 RepID=A0A916UF87_9HYPH|nr:hypothetical protein [Chelatococcus reniformis]GGC70804.1 hypothetical protein GCM10010994_31720 [Chelatococcus reniformis]